jgi:pyruvate dehydrogenase complex dehydrogenase (E1) component
MLGQLGKRRMGMAFDILRYVERMKPVDADQENVFNMTAVVTRKPYYRHGGQRYKEKQQQFLQMHVSSETS